jgi:uncharacterized phage protein gp47/JayE
VSSVDPWRYEPLDVETDPDAVVRQALDRIAARLEGWVPHSAAVEVIVSEELARINAVTRQSVQRVGDWILAEAGQRLYDIEREFGTAAGGTVEFAMLDDLGYVIPSGTRIAYHVSGSEQVEFATVESLAINAGDTTGTVGVEAVEAGSHANGLGPGAVELLESLSAVDTVELTTQTSGGADPETLTEYLAKLVQRTRLLHITAIHASHFAVLAADTAGVHRALALDLYDPATPDQDVDGAVTVVPVDTDGLAVAGSTKSDVEAALDERRVLNVAVHTMDPIYTPVDVAATVRRQVDVDSATLASRCEQAIRDWLAPSRWADPAPDDDAVDPAWTLRDTVRHLEAASVLAVVDGVDFVESLTLDGGTSDVTLSGDAPLPAPFDSNDATSVGVSASTVTITVTDPA